MSPYYLIAGAILLLISVLVSKVSDRLGIPTLLLFLMIGMLAGSEGLGVIRFSNAVQAQAVGIIALVLILFTGGLSTEWSEARSVATESILLATVGVLITATVTGVFASLLLRLPLVEAVLLASIMSSTDAAAVFAILRSRSISLQGTLRPLLELEAGCNDPMAVFLTVSLIQLATNPHMPLLGLVVFFLRQMLLGGAIGFIMSRLGRLVINRVNLRFEGLYPVLTLALVFLTYGLTDAAQGSGFLAVYVMGILLRRSDFVHRGSLLRFHDGLAWLMQITVFLTLGVFAVPSHLIPVMGLGILLAAILIFIGRPAGVFAISLVTRLGWRESAFISWVGLRGSVPIILATFPLVAGIASGELIFNVIFFVVLTSVLVQGTSIPVVARWLKLEGPLIPTRSYPLEYEPMTGLKSDLKEVFVPPNSGIAGKAIYELGLPAQVLIVLVARGDEFIVPKGETVVEENDTLLVLADEASYEAVLAIARAPKES